MGKKILMGVLIFAIIVGIGGYVILSRLARLDAAAINAYVDGEVTASTARDIILATRINTNNLFEFNTDETKVDITLTRIKGRQKDAVVVLRQKLEKCVIALYEKRGDVYKFVALVGTFTDVREAQALPIREQGGSAIIVRDRVNSEGTQATYIKGYAWQDDHFTQVLSILERYCWYHNELADKNKPANRSNWQRLSQRADMVWQDEDSPVLHVLFHQTYGLSILAAQEKLPADNEFELVRSRDVMEQYAWSGRWMHFILFEATNLKNGEPCAVVEDLAGSPYGLLSEYSGETDKFRVKYLDGEMAIVDKADIKPGIEIKRTRSM
ncbi:MAG: hypothetical protein LBL96_10925 [Clostridiales bacterium]|nr:hypothetical protein [Clostridiales bacterium]